MGKHASGRLAAAGRPRISEWILATYFAYTSVLALVLQIPSGMRARTLVANVAVVVLYALLLCPDGRPESKWRQISRDWLPLALAILAYREMSWFAPANHTHQLERGWMVWDRVVLGTWGLQALIESAGALLPSILDLCYILVYALPPFSLSVLYACGRRPQADTLLSIYLLGLFFAYAQFPFWPSEPPRVVFPEEYAPLSNIFHRFNLAFLSSQGMHTSVFPSAHVSGAFAISFALRRLLPDKPWIRWGVFAYSVLMAVATVYGRYHYTVDALAGLAMAIAADQIGGRRRSTRGAEVARSRNWDINVPRPERSQK